MAARARIVSFHVLWIVYDGISESRARAHAARRAPRAPRDAAHKTHQHAPDRRHETGRHMRTAGMQPRDI